MEDYEELVFTHRKREYITSSFDKVDKKIEYGDEENEIIEYSPNMPIKENSSSDTTNFEPELSEENSRKKSISINNNLYLDSYLLKKSYDFLKDFMDLIIVDESYSEKIKRIKKLAQKIKSIFNSEANHNSKIFYGVDKIYSRTYFFKLLKNIHKTLNDFQELDYFSLKIEFSYFESFANFFMDKKKRYFKFITNFRNLSIDLLKRELLIYFFVYKDMACNGKLIDCFNISNHNIKFYDNFLEMKFLRKIFLSKLNVKTLMKLLSIQGINVQEEELVNAVENEFKELNIFYSELPKNILSFSLINKKILININLKDKYIIKNCNVQAKAILLIILLGEFSNLISRKFFCLKYKSEYFENNYYFECNGKSTNCFDWFFNNVFGGISYFYKDNSKYILDSNNYCDNFTDYNEFRKRLMDTLQLDKDKNEKKLEIYDI